MGWKKSLCEECLIRMYIFVYTHLFLYSPLAYFLVCAHTFKTFKYQLAFKE